MEGKIRKIGNSLGVILPKQIIDELHLKSGDKVTMVWKGDIIVMRPVDSEFEDWAEAYKEANTNYKDVLKALAK